VKSSRVILVLAIAAALVTLPSGVAVAACHAFSFDKSSYAIGEAGGSVTLKVSRDGSQLDSSIQYDTVDGAAKAGSDYTAVSGTLSYTGSELEKSIVVPIRNDTKDEPNESFGVRLHDPAGCFGSGYSFPTDPVTVTITDNDPKPQPSTSSTPTRSSSPRPNTSSPTPAATKSTSPSASPSPSPTPTTTPTPTQTAVAAAGETDRGLSGGALAGIVAAVVVLGGAGAFVIRRRFLT
jgi:Calx-beta domain-containing protein